MRRRIIARKKGEENDGNILKAFRCTLSVRSSKAIPSLYRALYMPSSSSRIFRLVLIYSRFTSCPSAPLAINCVDASANTVRRVIAKCIILEKRRRLSRVHCRASARCVDARESPYRISNFPGTYNYALINKSWLSCRQHPW